MVYLIHGEERFIMLHYRNEIKKKYVDENDEMNFTAFYDNVDIRILRNAITTLPFFKEYRVVICENTGLLKKASDLVSVFEQCPESTVLVFVEDEIDKRGKAYKWIQKNGTLKEAKKQSESSLRIWIKEFCRKKSVTIDSDAIETLLFHCGTDMFRLKNEIEKLLSFTNGHIFNNDVKTLSIQVGEDTLFHMLDAMGTQKKDVMMKDYRSLLLLREEPIKILSMLNRHVRILFEVGEVSGNAAQLCGIPPFTVMKYKAQAQNFTRSQLKNMLERCATMESMVKRGQMKGAIALELLLTEFAT